ncbi:MAG: methyltransferase [Anaerolineae bacterium]|nr:methyltransferase [Anaerolineae bacterium]NIN98070.1 methyltransferase [Anaerolineae bacterium]
MEIRTGEDVKELLRAPIVSAALGAAIELGLFWQVTEEPATVESLSQSHGIPLNRCLAWLELLTDLGLLERQGDAYRLSTIGRTAITDVYSPESWGVLAQEARNGYPAGDDLTRTIAQPTSVWEALGRERHDYYANMAQEPEYARRFTQMLYEYHQQLAEEIADTLDVAGVKRMMDLGGGSGVISMAILRRHRGIEAVVVDVETVCNAGRAIAAKTPLADRLTYHEADFLRDELPRGFDLILQCDVGVHSGDLFRRLRTSLNPGGRLVVVDDLVQEGRAPPSAWLRHAFFSTLSDPNATIREASRVKDYIIKAGYRVLSERTLRGGEALIEARLL